MVLILAKEAARMFLRRIDVAFNGTEQYGGSAEKICSQIIKDCYDQKKDYFMTSSGHFCEFYCRDFGWCTQSLIGLGYRNEVISTLAYALQAFKRHGRVEQSINPKGKAFTFPSNKYSPDALAFLVHSLRLANAAYLVNKYKRFLDEEIKKYYELVIDHSTGLVRKDESFSSIKDYSVRRSSCYDNCVTGMLAQDLAQIKVLDNPFAKHGYDYSRLLMNHFWAGEYFLDDLSGDKRICGDANYMPFWTGIITDKKILAKAIASVRKEGLDKPFPLRYTAKRHEKQKMIPLELLAGDYERGTVGAHLGMMYIKVAAMHNPGLARKYLLQYKEKIEENHNFLEVYDTHGKPFKTLLYYSDESMLWAANYLFMSKNLLGRH
jgi:hypothetical protein